MRHLTFSFNPLQWFSAFMPIALSFGLNTAHAQTQAWNTANATNIPAACAANVPIYTFDPGAGYTSGNAFLALLASKVAEDTTDAGIKLQLAGFGFSKVHLIGNIPLGAYGFIAENDDVRILTFRGTHSVQEFLTDLTAGTVPYSDIGLSGEGHAGMRKSFKDLWPSVQKDLAARQLTDPKPLIVIGHSLGGSLALIHAVKLKQLGYDIQAIYTFAEPRLGDATLMAQVDALVGDRLYRMENGEDPVPRLPPTKENAQAFADVFTAPGTQNNSVIEKTVENMSYAPLPGWVVELNADGFAEKHGNSMDYEQELLFFQNYKAKLAHQTIDHNIGIEIGKSIFAHIGRAYICSFLNLVGKGYEPLSSL